MSGNIHAKEYRLSKIFSSDFEYVIPPYQRPYAWREEQAGELFDDLFGFHSSTLKEEYFLGSIVLVKKKESSPHSEVIDGQQRLTTLTILLAVLADTVEGNLKNELQRYILQEEKLLEGIESKPRLTLRKRDNDFFRQYIQELRFNELFSLDDKGLDNEAQQNIKRNSLLFKEKIRTELENDPNKIQQFAMFLIQRCFLVTVSTSNQQSAFRIFSVMNSRGLDLQPTDILKADIIGELEKEEERQTYNDRWEKMETELGRETFNDLFNYIRMIYAKAKSKQALLEEFKHYVISKVNEPKTLIEDILEPYAKVLTIIKASNYKAEAKSEEVNAYLKWLNKIDNSDWIPVAIHFLKAKRNDPLYVEWFFERLERLAAFMHITAYNINHRIVRYKEILTELDSNQNHTLTSPITTIELTDAEKEEMLKALDGNIYEMTAKRRNYLILRLDSFSSDNAASYKENLLTIEHVLPQTVDPQSKWAEIWPDEEERKKWVHRIANLVPLTRTLNSSAQNYDFDKKKTAYFPEGKEVSSYTLTSKLLRIKEWTPEVVEKRQQELLNVMKEKWKL